VIICAIVRNEFQWGNPVSAKVYKTYFEEVCRFRSAKQFLITTWTVFSSKVRLRLSPPIQTFFPQKRSVCLQNYFFTFYITICSSSIFLLFEISFFLFNFNFFILNINLIIFFIKKKLTLYFQTIIYFK
jgi:hypothetical protein